MPRTTKPRPVDTADDLATLEQTRADLSARLALADRELQEARRRRRDTLLTAGNSAEDQAGAETAYRDAESRQGALPDIMHEIEARIAETIQLELEKAARSSRESRLAALAGSADAIEAAVARMAEAAEIIGAAWRDLAAAIPDDVQVKICPTGNPNLPTSPMAPEDIASAVLADAMVSSCPDAFRLFNAAPGAVLAVARARMVGGVAYHHSFNPGTDFAEPLDARASAQSFVLDAVQTRMEAIGAEGALVGVEINHAA